MPCNSVHFDAIRDIPDLSGKVIIVTGGNAGIGKQCVLDYARHNPAEIWMAARNPEKAKPVIAEIQAELSTPANIKVLQLDLSSLSSVQRAAEHFKAEASRLDILMMNAGIMNVEPALTTDGYEVQFGTNYLGHALFAKLLLPLLTETAKKPQSDVRVIMLSSDAHAMGPKEGVVFDSLRTQAEKLGGFQRYGQSKTAQILWTRKMARLYPQLTFASIHPGVVQTNLQGQATATPLALRMVMKVGRNFLTTVDKGARNQLWASVSQEVVSGEYYTPVGVGGGGSNPSKDPFLMEKLWEWTEEQLGFFTVA